MDRKARLNQIILIGDAKAQLSTTDGGGGASSFGGGVQYRSTNWLVLATLGTAPGRDVLTTRETIGPSILSPWTSKIYMDVVVEWMWAARALYTGKFDWGLRARTSAGGTSWGATAEDGTSQSKNVNTVGVDAGIGGRQVFVADDVNHVEAFVFLGPHVRAVGGDANKAYRRQVLSSPQAFFPGGLLFGGLRIGRLEIGTQLSLTIQQRNASRVEGLTNLQLLVGLELRDGPSVGGDAKPN